MKKLLFLTAFLAISATQISADEKSGPTETKRSIAPEEVRDLAMYILLPFQAYRCTMLWLEPSFITNLDVIYARLRPFVRVNPFILPTVASQASTASSAYFYAKTTENALRNSYENYGNWAACNARQGLINAFDGSIW